MKIGIFAPLRSPVASPELIGDLAVQAEQMGIHSLWLGEHVVLFPSYESKYPGSADGRFVFPENSGLLDMTATLGFLAARTKTLRLGTGIRILPQANPVYTAKEYATLDFLSNGRIDFGVGVGWSWEEFEACGVSFERRGERCDEYLGVIRTLWCDEVSSYDGEFYSLRDCLMYPKPVQTPMIPVTVGGHSAAALRRTARFASGWFGINIGPEEVAATVEKLNRYLAQMGREPGSVRIIIGTTGASISAAQISAFAQAGTDEILLPYMRQSHKWLASFMESLKPHLDEAAKCR